MGDAYRPKRSKNFDMTPEDYQRETGAPPPPPVNVQIALQKVQAVQQQAAQPLQIRSVIDQREKDRVEKATQRNLEYIKKKIAEEAAKKFGFDRPDFNQYGPGGAVGGHEVPGAEGVEEEEEDDDYLAIYGAAAAAAASKPKKRLATGVSMKRSRAGIGSGPMASSAGVEATSVYVSGLAPDASWSQLDMLFAPYGTVKRIKIYRDSAGKPKGDALVTFAKEGSVSNAINKLDGYPIAPGHQLSISKADFSHQKDGEAYHDGLGLHVAHPGQEEAEQADYEQLPPECESDKYPVVILRNVYRTEDAEGDPDFYADLEADMLSECVKFGNVRRIVTPEGVYYDGSVAVVFADEQGAQKCAEAMHGRFFDGQQIEVEMQGRMDPSLAPVRIAPQVQHQQDGPLVSSHYGDEDEEEEQRKAKRHEGGGNMGGDAPVAAAEDDVEDFFRTLI